MKQALVALIFLIGLAQHMTLAATHPAPPHSKVEKLEFAGIPGWQQDNHVAAFRAFRTSCQAMVANAPALRPAVDALPTLLTICAKAVGLPDLSQAEARAFFETHFQPYQILPEASEGFLTGYFEPEIAGSLEKTEKFSAPVYGRPADLVTLHTGVDRQGLDPALAAARQGEHGLEPYMIRSDIYAGALKNKGLEQLWLRDEPEVFIVQVQGSARVRLPDGRRVRLSYAGRNGHPYTSIGRLLIEEGKIDRNEMSLARLMGWLRANPVDAVRVMSANKSYVFFAREDDIDPARGPTGGAGVPLTPGRSLAVDRAIWPYGLPIWCAADIDTLEAESRKISQLMIAQDTGSAIVGPARADYFWGTGEEAGRKAGLTRHRLQFTVLWPKD